MEPGDLKQFVPGEITEDGHAASGFQLGLWSVLEPFLPVEPCVVLEHTAGPRLPPTRSTFKRQHLVQADTFLPARQLVPGALALSGETARLRLCCFGGDPLIWSGQDKMVEPCLHPPALLL